MSTQTSPTLAIFVLILPSHKETTSLYLLQWIVSSRSFSSFLLLSIHLSDWGPRLPARIIRTMRGRRLNVIAKPRWLYVKSMVTRRRLSCFSVRILFNTGFEKLAKLQDLNAFSIHHYSGSPWSWWVLPRWSGQRHQSLWLPSQVCDDHAQRHPSHSPHPWWIHLINFLLYYLIIKLLICFNEASW